MTNITPFPSGRFTDSPPDYRKALLRTADKLKRTERHYRKIALCRRASAMDDDVADSLERCADDLSYIFQRIVFNFPNDEIADLKAGTHRDLKAS